MNNTATNNTAVTHTNSSSIVKVFFFIGMAMTFIGVHVAFSRLTVGSESVKPYLLFRTDEIPQQGDYVTFPFHHPLIQTKAKYWVKLLACNEGQYLLRHDNHFYCDGIFFADARLLSKRNEPLPQFYYDGRIPAGHAFVLGDGQNSFDSRHFGFVSKKQMVVNKPLI